MSQIPRLRTKVGLQEIGDLSDNSPGIEEIGRHFPSKCVSSIAPARKSWPPRAPEFDQEFARLARHAREFGRLCLRYRACAQEIGDLTDNLPGVEEIGRHFPSKCVSSIAHAHKSWPPGTPEFDNKFARLARQFARFVSQIPRLRTKVSLQEIGNLNDNLFGVEEIGRHFPSKCVSSIAPAHKS